MAAMAVAPMAMQLVRAAGSGVASSAKSARKNDVGQDAEICDMGGRQPPPLIELRTDKLGTTRYRPMTPRGPQSDPQVTAIMSQSGNGGWRLAANFTTMNFQPPLQNVLVLSSVTYLAYAPAEARDPSEHAQLDALNQSFGPTTGTFDWNGRSYRYTASINSRVLRLCKTSECKRLAQMLPTAGKDQRQFRANDLPKEHYFQDYLGVTLASILLAPIRNSFGGREDRDRDA